MMHTQPQNIQVVFLIDVNRNINGTGGENDVQETTNRIKLSTFRLLDKLSAEVSLFSVSKNSKSKPLKWGYKFFSSSSHNSKIEQHNLKDFKLRYFEEFENEVERRFEEDFKRQLEAARKNVQTPLKSTSSSCLMKALTEILYDFQWEMPDLMSPVKGRKRMKNAKGKDLSRSRNYVFLFSDCPKTQLNLRKFAGKKVIDDSVLLDSVMPPSLFHKFSYSHGLRLFWIDTSIVLVRLGNKM